MRELDQKALEAAKWEIDYSAGSPILTYEKCSVIQDEQAHYIMRLLRQDAALPSAPAVEGVERTFEDVIETIAGGNFYADYDQSSSDLGVLRKQASAISRLTSLLTTATDEFAALRDASTKEISRLTALLAEARADPTTEQVERALVAWHDILSIKNRPRSEFWRMFAAISAARRYQQKREAK